MSNTYATSRSIVIAAPAASVWERIADFRSWRSWSPFEDLDPTMERTYSGAGVGAVYEWRGSMKAGTGRMEITGAEAGRRLRIDQRNLKPLASRQDVTFVLEPRSEGTEVTWSVEGGMSGIGRMLGRFAPMEAMIGAIYDQGLARLKAELETAPAA